MFSGGGKALLCLASMALLSSSLTVSTSANTVAVPDVEGLSKADAITEVEEANLKVGRIRGGIIDILPAGTIIKQTPEAGSQVATGSEVDLVVSLPALRKGPRIPGSWVGQWEIRIEFLTSPTQNLAAVEEISDLICRGDRLGLGLLESHDEEDEGDGDDDDDDEKPRDCHAQVGSNHLAVSCTSRVVVSDTCNLQVMVDLLVDRNENELQGSGQ